MPFIGLPAIVILAVVVLKTFSGPEPTPTVQVDPNAEFRDLEKEIPALQKECSAVIGLIQKEDPSAKTRTERLRETIETWMGRWDRIIEPLRDAESDRLPPEYQGYQQIRTRVNTLRLDLLKSSPW